MRTIILLSPEQAVTARWRDILRAQYQCPSVHNSAQLNALQGHPAIALYHLAWLRTALGHALLTQLFADAAIHVVIFSDQPNEKEGLQYLSMGAFGYANTHMQAALLRQLAQVVSLGQVWVGKKLMQHLLTTSAPQKPPQTACATLTARELEIACKVAQGAANKTIAQQLGITPRTVKAHLTAVFKKTGCRDRLQLALWMQQADDADAGKKNE